MACFSPKPLYQTSEPTLASAALVQANRFAQQGRYDPDQTADKDEKVR